MEKMYTPIHISQYVRTDSNTLNPMLLTTKFKELKVNQYCIMWLYSFLNNHTQQVRVNN